MVPPSAPGGLVHGQEGGSRHGMGSLVEGECEVSVRKSSDPKVAEADPDGVLAATDLRGGRPDFLGAQQGELQARCDHGIYWNLRISNRLAFIWTLRFHDFVRDTDPAQRRRSECQKKGSPSLGV